jgi:hypothetical protein
MLRESNDKVTGSRILDNFACANMVNRLLTAL